MIAQYTSKTVTTIVVFVLFSLVCLQLNSAFANPKVLMETSKGDITIELFEKEAPRTVKNFLTYASEGFFNNLIFHRVIKDFMIQGGGMDSEMRQKDTKPPIKNEARRGLGNNRGTIAMARTNIIDSATAQFFINLKDNDFLNHTDRTARGFGYCVFGEVTKGMDVVDSIARVKTGNFNGFQDVPKEPVFIKNVSIIE
ncbi:MAG: Peptidyl-prolyl cis-trans isomerase B [Candidatus Scalindua arabica]|uniref:Peptidyl-prolyl cis-trans isomerase n=1 Tax=Candidatus Scalindua arabica TaxID=1127984 RepID=A0A942A3I9_9BACT|nr:Peptidyl-prolyl cis-trans isomerase B [Candidatus Scalindua arabica]